MNRKLKISSITALTLLVTLVAVGGALAWDRTWTFVNPTFNSTSLSGAYLQFTAEASGGGGGEDGGLGDIDQILSDALDGIETFNLDIQEGIGNIEIEQPSVEAPAVEAPNVDLN